MDGSRGGGPCLSREAFLGPMGVVVLVSPRVDDRNVVARSTATASTDV